MINEDRAKPTRHSHLFTVRLWLEELGDGQSEWRGQVQHVLSGETRYFREWASLGEVLAGLVAELEDREGQYDSLNR
jgi:hypothetical protein